MPDPQNPHVDRDYILVFDRTPVARLISCAAVFGSAAIFFEYLSSGESSVLVGALLAVLVVGTILSALMQYGDHIYVAREGCLYNNRLLPIMGKANGMLWDEIVEIREVRRKILVLLSADGRRLLVDAIADYATARKEILRRAPHAVISGTLRKEDRE
jgi:hypothetical protein